MNGRSRIFFGALFAGYAALTGCQASVGSNAPLALGERDVSVITSDDFFVYWVTSSGLVKRVSLDGGKVEQLASGAAGPAFLAADEHDLFVAFGDGTVNRIPKKGGSVTPIAQGTGVHGLALDATHVYFSEGTVVRRVDKDGSLDVLPIDLAKGLKSPGRLVAVGTLLLQDGPTIRELDVRGGTPTVILTASTDIANLYAASGHALWTESGSETTPGGLHTAALDGTGSRLLTEVDSAATRFVSIVSDESNAYYTTQAGEVRVASLGVDRKTSGPTSDLPDQGIAGAGGASNVSGSDILLSGGANQAKLAIDATSIYAATNDESGSIIAVRKPVATSSPSAADGGARAE